MDYFIQLIRPSQNSDELQSLLFVAELAQKWVIQESLHQRNAENEFHGQFAKNLLLRLSNCGEEPIQLKKVAAQPKSQRHNQFEI